MAAGCGRCVCARFGENESESERERGRERGREGESVCVSCVRRKPKAPAFPFPVPVEYIVYWNSYAVADGHFDFKIKMPPGRRIPRGETLISPKP